MPGKDRWRLRHTSGAVSSAAAMLAGLLMTSAAVSAAFAGPAQRHGHSYEQHSHQQHKHQQHKHQRGWKTWLALELITHTQNNAALQLRASAD